MKLTPSDIAEIYFITDLVNMPSILKHGILSHNLVAKKKIQHSSIANVDVQGRRINKVIPGGKKLHDYANLYINARNPMLYVLLPKQRELCVIRISADVLRSAGVIVSDKNAARDWARFEPWPDGLNRIGKEDIFRERWDVSDPFEKDHLKGVMCAEILVPYKVDSRYILGAYVSCQEAFDRLAELCPGFAVTINRRLFF
ncbi:hypothetical protein A2W24_00560 [Microgenomates group bacterium RBG_16_45_19]|nr:MAG: hypothetical protein A2W24_00560 [Microgenomates group bacterium RBG_16_45_19]